MPHDGNKVFKSTVPCGSSPSVKLVSPDPYFAARCCQNLSKKSRGLLVYYATSANSSRRVHSRYRRCSKPADHGGNPTDEDEQNMLLACVTQFS